MKMTESKGWLCSQVLQLHLEESSNTMKKELRINLLQKHLE